MNKIVDRLLEHHKNLWGHNPSTDSIMTDAAAELRRLYAANEIMTGALRAIAGETKTGPVWGVAQGALDIALQGSFESAKQRGNVEH